MARWQAGSTTLALFWLPELLLGRPIVGSSWLGIVALFFPFGLAFGILRYHLFDIDVVINRTLVYGGLTLGILASYAIVAAALRTLVGSEHGIGVELLATGAAALIALPLRDVLQRTVNRLMYGERDEPWRAMHRLGDVLEWAAEPDRAFPAIVDTVADALRLPFVALALVDVDGTERVVADRGELRGSTVDMPLVHGTERVGRLVLGVRSGETGFRGDELRLLEDLGAAGGNRDQRDPAAGRSRAVAGAARRRPRGGAPSAPARPA